MEEYKQFIEKIKEKYDETESNLIEILNEVQDNFGYIPLEIQKELSEYLNVSMAHIYGVITFYSRFSLKPKAKYSISICMGTACYVKGAKNLSSHLEALLNIKTGEVTSDKVFGIVENRCVGACSLAPVFTINDKVYGNATCESLENEIDKLKNNQEEV